MDELLKFKSESKQATLDINKALQQSKDIEILKKVKANREEEQKKINKKEQQKELTRDDISIPLEVANQIGEKKHETFRELDKKTDFQIFQNNIDAQQAKEANQLKAQQAQETLLYKYDDTYNNDILAPIFSTEQEPHLNRVSRAIKADKAYDYASNVSIPTELKHSNQMVDLKLQQANSKALAINNFIKKQINDEFQYMKDNYKDYAIAYVKEYNRLGVIGDEALQEAYAKAYELTTNNYAEMTQTNGPLDNIIRGVIHTTDSWASLGASLSASLREGTLTFKDAPILEKFLESAFDYKSYNKYEAFGTASVIQDNVMNTLRLLPVANAISTFAESLPEMIELGIMGSGFAKGWNQTVLDARNALIAEKTLTKNMSKHIDRQIKLADFKGNTKLKERLEALKLHLTNPAAKTITKDEFSSIAGAVASTFNKVSFWKGLRNAGPLPFTLLALEYAKRGVDLYKYKPEGYQLTLWDSMAPLIHLFVDYAGIVGMLGAKNVFVGARNSLYNKQEIARLSAKKTLTKVEKDTLELLKQANKTRLGDGLRGSILGGFAIEGFGEMIQTHLEQQVQSGYALPSFTSMLFNEYNLSSLREKQEDMYRTGMLGGLGGALAGGVSNITSNILNKVNEYIDDKKQKKLDEILKQNDTELAYVDTKKDIETIKAKTKQILESIKNGLLSNENNDSNQATQSASNFQKEQENSFKQLDELDKKVSEYETKSNNETVKQIKQSGAKDNRNKIRIVEQRLNDLYAKEMDKSISEEEKVELNELKAYKESLEEQYVRQSAIVVANTMAEEVLPQHGDITIQQVNALTKMLEAKTIDEFNEAQKEFRDSLDLSKFPNLQKIISKLLNRDNDKVSEKVKELNEVNEDKALDKTNDDNNMPKRSASSNTQAPTNANNVPNNTQTQNNNTQSQSADTNNTNTKPLTDEELSKMRIDNIDPFIFNQAIVKASREARKTKNSNNKQWENYVAKNTIVRIDNKQLTDTSNVTDKTEEKYFNQDNVEVFSMPSELVDDNGNVISYIDSYHQQKFNKAISTLVNIDKDNLNNNFRKVIEAIKRGNIKEANKALTELHEQNVKDLTNVKDSLDYIEFLIAINPKSRLSNKLLDLKQKIMYRLENTDKEINKLYKEVQKFNNIQSPTEVESNNILEKISNTTSNIFSGIRAAVNAFLNSDRNNKQEKNKLLSIIKKLEKILSDLISLRQSKEFQELQNEVYIRLANRVYTPLTPTEIKINLLDKSRTVKNVKFKGVLKYLSIPMKIFASDFYGRVNNSDFMYSIIDKLIAEAINDNANDILIEELKPILDSIRISVPITETQQVSESKGRKGKELTVEREMSLYEMLKPNSESVKRTLTDSQLNNLGITRNSDKFNAEVAAKMKDIKKIFKDYLENKNIKERLAIAVNQPDIKNQLEMLLDIGLFLQAKIIFQNQNAHKIDPKQSNMIVSEMTKFIENSKDFTKEQISDLANVALALANTLASQKNYKKQSLLTIADDYGLIFNKVFKNELADEYKNTIDEWSKILDTEVYSSNDKALVEKLSKGLAKLSSGRRKTALLNLQNVSHNLDKDAIEVFKKMFGIDKNKKLSEYFSNSNKITMSSSEYNKAKEKFYEDSKGDSDFKNKVRSNLSSSEWFFNYIRVPTFNVKDGALVKDFEYVYVPDLTLDNQTIKNQFDGDIVEGLLTSVKTRYDSVISKLESRTSELGYTLFLAANAESSLNNNGNIEQSVKYIERQDETGKLIEIDFSKEVYYLLALQDNGRVFIQDSITSPMSNIFLRDLTNHNVPQKVWQYNEKTKENVEVDNIYYYNWGGLDMSKVSNKDLRDNKAYENQKLMVLNQLVRSLAIDYDKLDFDENTIKALNDPNIEREIKAALAKTKSSNEATRLQGYQDLINIVDKYKKRNINLLRQTYMSKGTVNGKKVDVRHLLDRLLSTDPQTVAEAIQDYKTLLSQVSGDNFKSDHPMLTYRAQQSILNAIEGDKFNIQKLKLNYGSIYADGSATFMMENAIRLKTHVLGNVLSNVSKTAVKHDNKAYRFGTTLADTFDKYYTKAKYLEIIKQQISKLPNQEIQNHLLDILDNKKLDPHTLNLVTTSIVMNLFGNNTLMSAILSQSTILDRDTIKPPGTVSSYGSGIEGILNKFLELVLIKQEPIIMSILEQLEKDTTIVNGIKQLLSQDITKEDAENIEADIINKFQNILKDKANNAPQNSKEKSLLDTLSNFYSNSDNVRKLLFNEKSNITYLNETRKDFDKRIQELKEQGNDVSKEESKRLEDEKRFNEDTDKRYLLFSNFKEQGIAKKQQNKFDPNKIGTIIENNLKNDIDKIKTYYSNFGVIEQGRINSKVFFDSNKLAKLIKNDNNKAVFKLLFTPVMFKNLKRNDSTDTWYNDYFEIKIKDNDRYEVIFKSKFNDRLIEFRNKYGSNALDEDIKEMIVRTASLYQQTGELFFEHNPLSAIAMPLLEVPRQSSKYFNEHIKNVQNKLVAQLYRNIVYDLIEILKNKKIIDSNATLETLSDYLGDNPNEKLYNIMRANPEIEKIIRHKTNLFLNDYFREIYNDDSVFLNVFNRKPTEEQRTNFMEAQKQAVSKFMNELNLDSTNLANLISFSTKKTTISTSDNVTEQVVDLRTTLPNVGALFNHPFEAFFLTAEENGMLLQVFDAMFGTPVSIDSITGNWSRAGLVDKSYFDNSYVLYNWFYNIDKISVRRQYPIKDFLSLTKEEQIETIEVLESIIKHYLNITDFFSVNTQNINSLNRELNNQTELNRNLNINFKQALLKLKKINDLLSQSKNSSLRKELEQKINFTLIGNEDINVFKTKKKIDGKEQTLVEYLSDKTFNTIDTKAVIRAFGNQYTKDMNNFVERALKVDYTIDRNYDSLELIDTFKRFTYNLLNKFGFNIPANVLYNNSKNSVERLGHNNIFTIKKDGRIFEGLVDTLTDAITKNIHINDTAVIDTIKEQTKIYLSNNSNISVDEFVNHIVADVMSQYFFETLKSKNKNIDDNILKQQVLSKIGNKSLAIHNLHVMSSKGKITIDDVTIDISELFNIEYELFDTIFNNKEIIDTFQTQIDNLSKIINKNNKLNKVTHFVNPYIIGDNNKYGIIYSFSRYGSNNKFYYANPEYNGNNMNTIIFKLTNYKPINQNNNNNTPNTSNNTNQYTIRKYSSNTTNPNPGTAIKKEVSLDEYINDIIADIDEKFKNYQDDSAVMDYVNKLKEQIKDLARNARMGLRIFYYQNSDGIEGQFDPNTNTISIFDTNNKNVKLHEFIHAITEFALNSNTNEANILKNKILAIHKQIRNDEDLQSAIPDIQHLLNNDELGNIAETLAIMLSTPSAVKALSQRQVRIPFKYKEGQTRLGSLFKALPLLVKYLFQLANHKLKREPSSSLEFLYKTMTDLSEINTLEGEANLKEQYDAKLINRLNAATRNAGMKILDAFLGKTESFKNLTLEEQKMYSKKIKDDIDKAISISSLTKHAIRIKNYKGSAFTKGVMTALWLLKSTYYKNSNILPFLTNPIQRAIVRETIADLRQRVIENTIFDAKVMLDFGIYSTNFLKNHINLINRATNARTKVNYEIEASKYEARQAIKTYLLFTSRLKEMLKDEKDFKAYSESVSKLVFHHNLGDYFVGYENIPESELKELAYTVLNSRNENVREQAQTRIDAKINEALYLLKISNDSNQAKVIRKTITDLAYTRYSDKLNKYGISNIEMALKRLDVKFNYANDKQALQNLHQAITLKSIILPYQMKDSSSKYLQSKTNEVLNKYLHEKEIGDTELANDIEKSLQYIISYHARKLEELYSKKVLNSDLEQTKDFYRLDKTDKLYFMEDKDMYHKVSALERNSEDAYYLESFKPYAYNPNKTIISIDPSNLDKQFSIIEQARKYYETLGFKYEKTNEKGIETYIYEGFNQYSTSRETPSFIFQTLDHKGQVFKPFNEEDVSLYKPTVNDKFLEQMKKEFLDSAKDYDENYIPNVNDTYGMSSSKSFAGSETMLRENMSNEELETLTNVNTTAESMFEQMEKYIMENKIKDYVNNQIYYQLIIGDKEIQKNRKSSLDDTKKFHHTEVLFNIENGRVKFNKDLIEKYGFQLTRQDESDFTKMYKLVNGNIGVKDKVYIDTRLLPVMFGFNKANIAETVKNYPLAYKGLSAMQKALSFLIKEGKNNTIIRNPSLVITNATANFFGLIAEGVQLKEMESWTYYTEQLDKYQEDYKQIKAKEAKIKELNKVRKTQDEINEIDKLNKEINVLKESRKRNSVAPLVDAGMYSNIIEDIETTEWKWDKELIKSIETDEAKKNYLNEFMMTESSDAYKTLADMTRKGDFIPRVILYYHLINKKGYSTIEALDEVRDRFINYSTPLFSPTGRMLDRTGIMLYQKYRFAVQKQALLALKNAPVSALAVISTQELFANMGFHTPWSVTSYLSENLMFGGNLPSGLWNMGTSMFASVNRWNYVTP